MKYLLLLNFHVGLQKSSVSATPSAGVQFVSTVGKLFKGAHDSALNKYSHFAVGYLLNHWMDPFVWVVEWKPQSMCTNAAVVNAQTYSAELCAAAV